MSFYSPVSFIKSHFFHISFRFVSHNKILQIRLKSTVYQVHDPISSFLRHTCFTEFGDYHFYTDFNIFVNYLCMNKDDVVWHVKILYMVPMMFIVIIFFCFNVRVQDVYILRLNGSSSFIHFDCYVLFYFIIYHCFLIIPPIFPTPFLSLPTLQRINPLICS